MSKIIEELAEYIVIWFIAGFIVTLFSVLWTALTGGFVEKVTGLTLIAVVESFPFPFNLLVGWQLNPVSVIIDLILQFLVFIGLLFLKGWANRN